MPKQPYFESAIHHLLLQMRRIAEMERLYNPNDYKNWETFINSFTFDSIGARTVRVDWTFPTTGEFEFSLQSVNYYIRGDIEKSRLKQNEMEFKGDPIKEKNEQYFFSLGRKISQMAGFKLHRENNYLASYDTVSLKRYYDEENLSKAWVQTVKVNNIDATVMNEACTAPEMRYITGILGNLEGKTLLDIGCGLGEASVYFALKGAIVTATDISANMIQITGKLAEKYKVKVDTYRAGIEHLKLPKGKNFDVVYVGNLFHHVDIDKALEQIKLYLKPGGVLVSWEPVHYNPIINLYRKIAVKVRSADERPLKLADIDKFNRYFSEVQLEWFWLTTLVIFIIMVLVQRRDPNKERFWKTVVVEGEKWRPIYTPLARLDEVLLRMFPFLRPLCWNVVIIARGVRE